MISAQQLEDALTRAGIPAESITLLDADYVLPSPEWITDKLGASLNKMLFNSGIKYTPEAFDCDNYAKTASAIADWCWAKTKGQSEAALAFGLFGFATQSHMLNIAVHRVNRTKLYVAFYEPQPAVPENQAVFSLVCLTPVKLSREDLRSALCCWFF